MDELPGVIIAVLLIFFVFRYCFGKGDPHAVAADGTPTGGPLRGVTSDMIATVTAAFPNIPPPAVVYSLSKTRSAQATSEIILEQGALPIPPPTFPVHPYLATLAAIQASSTSSSTASVAAPVETNLKPSQSLIDRYGLSSRVRSTDKGKGKAAEQSDGGSQVGGAKWEGTAEERERSLKERKEKMVLEARRRLLEKKAAAAKSP